jgi:hypothetical protein
MRFGSDTRNPLQHLQIDLPSWCTNEHDLGAHSFILHLPELSLTLTSRLPIMPRTDHPPVESSSLGTSRLLESGGRRDVHHLSGTAGLFLRSESFQQLICGGVLPPPAVPLDYARGQGFPPLIRYEKTAPSHQSLQKNPPVPEKALVEAATFIYSLCPAGYMGHAKCGGRGLAGFKRKEMSP